MPFAYYGAKHALARHYPAPIYGTIIEPFAGSAAYSCYYAKDVDNVILWDKDPAVVALWERIQHITEDELEAISVSVATDERTSDPLLGGLAGSTSLHATLSGRDRKITPRMRKDWPSVRRRIERALPYVRNWTINQGDYTRIPNHESTWFIDPPYRTSSSGNAVAGNAYRHGQQDIDYDHLGRWCQQRSGQVIVCEQQPADWLPFQPFRKLKNGVAAPTGVNMEVMWTTCRQGATV